MARPTKYTEELGDLICDLIKEGKTQTQICMLESMPARSTIYEWQKKYEAFSNKYREAEVLSADTMMDKAYNNLNGIAVEGIWVDPNGTQFSDDQVKALTQSEKDQMGLKNIGLSSTLVQLRKEQFNASKQFAAIRNREKYADAKKLEHSGTLDVKSFLNNIDED